MRRNYQLVETFTANGREFVTKQSYKSLEDIKDFVPKAAKCFESYRATVIDKTTNETVWTF